MDCGPAPSAAQAMRGAVLLKPNCDCARWAECGAGSADSLRASPRESPSGPLRSRRRSAALASPERRARTTPPYKQPTPTPVPRPSLCPERTTLATVLQRTAPHVGTETACWVSHLVGRAVLHSAMTVAIHSMHYTLHAAACVLS